MCGIAGYYGSHNPVGILTRALQRLEYRGYDSCGMAIRHDDRIEVAKTVGSLNTLSLNFTIPTSDRFIGVAHTRWATHGKPSIENAHPHMSQNGAVCIAHNGIFDRAEQVRANLVKKGYLFLGQTDSEVFANRLEDLLNQDRVDIDHFRLFYSVRAALKELGGTYAVVVIHRDLDVMIACRQVSPLVLGRQGDSFLVSSDAGVLSDAGYQGAFIHDGECVLISASGCYLMDGSGHAKDPEFSTLPTMAISRDYVHPHNLGRSFLEREIAEQPEVVARLVNLNHFSGADWQDFMKKAETIDRIHIIGCGSALHAGWIGKSYLEHFAGIPTEIYSAGDYPYGYAPIDRRTLVVVLSQSGETIDTLLALRHACAKGANTVGVLNIGLSTIAREVNHAFFLEAGPEISVASTKVYTAMVVAMLMFSVQLGFSRGKLTEAGRADILAQLDVLPGQIARTLSMNELSSKVIANQFCKVASTLYLGRGLHTPVAYEGALKLKEISYIHAEAFPGSEIKHGPLALVSKNMPVIGICTKNTLYDRTISNLHEVVTRGGHLIVVATEEDREIEKISDSIFRIPQASGWMEPLLAVLPLQQYAYAVAHVLGIDCDKPRNLAKSVTVQ